MITVANLVQASPRKLQYADQQQVNAYEHKGEIAPLEKDKVHGQSFNQLVIINQ